VGAASERGVAAAPGAAARLAAATVCVSSAEHEPRRLAPRPHAPFRAISCGKRARRRCSSWWAATVPPRGERNVMRCAAVVATMQRLQRLQRFIKRKECLFAAVRASCARAVVRARACVHACRARRRSPTRVGRADAVEVLPVSVSVRVSLRGAVQSAPIAISTQRRTSGGGL
jgi:hypothetical protein